MSGSADEDRMEAKAKAIWLIQQMPKSYKEQMMIVGFIHELIEWEHGTNCLSNVVRLACGN